MFASLSLSIGIILLLLLKRLKVLKSPAAIVKTASQKRISKGDAPPKSSNRLLSLKGGCKKSLWFASS